jgi:ribosomal protein S18 acetylase RimI-like enzyme
MSMNLRLATAGDEAVVLELVRQYHEYDQISSDANATALALTPLLAQSDAGRIWLIELAGSTIGYIALCFGYSIEIGGRDAFVDEMYILAEHRGKGIGKTVLREIQSKARCLDIKALHLEVERTNERARSLYLSLGFSSRERFHLMTCAL